MKILNMVIPIPMHFCSFLSDWSVASHIKLHVTQRYVTNYFLQYSISHDVLLQNFDAILSDNCITKSSPLECSLISTGLALSLSNVAIYYKNCVVATNISHWLKILGGSNLHICKKHVLNQL